LVIVLIAENRFFRQMKTSRKVRICSHWFLYPRDTAIQSSATSLPIIYNFHVSYCF